MQTITLDFETFFSDDYTLSKMTTESYVRDPRFEAHGASIKWSENHNAKWYSHADLLRLFQDEDLSDCGVVMHHAQFDGLILSHHYGVKPKFIFDTLSMARLLIGNHLSVSLESLAKHFGLAAKTVPYQLFKGKHWNELSPAIQQQVADGADHDVDLTWDIFKRLAAKLPPEEFEVIDITCRMFTDPVLRGDTDVFAKVWEHEHVRRNSVLADLGVTPEQLQSSEQFATLLRAEGVEPETKEGKNGAIYAFAKTDPFMESLLGDEDERVRTLAEARLGIKSTLLQTRAETLGWMATRGPLCVYLRYAGAHTSRWSGGDDSNFQNWTNGSDINSAIVAPDGYLIAEPDCSQIECRLLNELAGQTDKVEEFRQGKDPYISVASEFYGFTVNKNDHPDERQLGKIVELQAGYQSGGEKIRATVRVKSGSKILLTPEEGVKARDAYRHTHPKVVDLWSFAELVIKRMDQSLSFNWGPMKVRCDVETGEKRIILPNGIELIYDTLDWHTPSPEEIEKTGKNKPYWRLKSRKGWTSIYGGKLVENVIQALARVVVSQAMIRLNRLGYRSVNTKHDSLWLLVPIDDRREEHLAVILREMSRQLPWMPDLPLSAEFKVVGERYA